MKSEQLKHDIKETRTQRVRDNRMTFVIEKGFQIDPKMKIWVHFFIYSRCFNYNYFIDLGFFFQFVFEGMEESGSEGLDDLVFARKDTFLKVIV